MLAYRYDKETKEYLGEQEAQINPLEGGYLLPANCTFVEPLSPKADNTIVWNDSEWVYVVDYRENYYKVDSELNVTEITEFGDLPEGYILVTKDYGELIKKTPSNYVIDNGTVREKTEEEKEAEAEAEFNKQFFKTALGYVRRNVTMKDGSVKDFLTDILPMLVVGVPVLVYDRELNQTRVQVTEAFINECKQQLFIDFYGVE